MPTLDTYFSTTKKNSEFTKRTHKVNCYFEFKKKKNRFIAVIRFLKIQVKIRIWDSKLVTEFIFLGYHAKQSFNLQYIFIGRTK